MINAFNRKVLFRDTDSQAAAGVWSVLKENGIRYEMATKTGKSSIRRMATQSKNVSYNAGGVPATWTDPAGNYIYVIYVNKKDYEKAKELCSL